MSHAVRFGYTLTATIVMIATFGVAIGAQNHAPNSYQTVEGWASPGRAWGSMSAVYPARDGSGNIWVSERCGANSCADTPDVDSVFLFDPSGKLVRSFGAGLIMMPHGMFVDADNNVWVTDTGTADGKGYQVHKFSPDGEVLMTLGTPGGAGNGPNSFNGPSDVLVAPGGDIFVAVGHLGRGDDNRIVKFSSDGTFIKTWGKTGTTNEDFHDPHALAMDSEGRLVVGDRYNNRVQIFDQDGTYIATWTQFGRPSGLYIDANDVLYSADSESNTRRNPGWKRGIRIGSATDGWITNFIPDPEPNADRSATSGSEGVAVDAAGNIYGAEVGPRDLKKYVKQ